MRQSDIVVTLFLATMGCSQGMDRLPEHGQPTRHATAAPEGPSTASQVAAPGPQAEAAPAAPARATPAPGAAAGADLEPELKSFSADTLLLELKIREMRARQATLAAAGKKKLGSKDQEIKVTAALRFRDPASEVVSNPPDPAKIELAVGAALRSHRRIDDLPPETIAELERALKTIKTPRLLEIVIKKQEEIYRINQGDDRIDIPISLSSNPNPNPVAGRRGGDEAVLGVRRPGSDAKEPTVDSNIFQAADSVVALVKTANMTREGDGSYSISTISLRESEGLCETERYLDQPVGAECSGVLVSSKLVVTAAHCFDGISPGDRRFVFGFRLPNAAVPKTRVAGKDVYSAARIVELRAPKDDQSAEWAIVELDREVKDHKPAKLRRSGKIANGQAVYIMGHPCGLPLKSAGNAVVKDNTLAEVFLANLDAFAGNSGSPVFNAVTHEVEGILVRGLSDFESNGTCNVAMVCPDIGCGGEQVARAPEFARKLP